MRWWHWIVGFFFAGSYGCVGEIGIATFMNPYYTPFFFQYYNGWHTSWEAFVWFGFAGVLAFWIYRRVRDRVRDITFERTIKTRVYEVMSYDYSGFDMELPRKSLYERFR